MTSRVHAIGRAAHLLHVLSLMADTVRTQLRDPQFQPGEVLRYFVRRLRGLHIGIGGLQAASVVVALHEFGILSGSAAAEDALAGGWWMDAGSGSAGTRACAVCVRRALYA